MKQDLKSYLFINLFIKTYLYRVVHNQIIIILFYSVALLPAKSKSCDNLKMKTIVTSCHVLAELS